MVHITKDNKELIKVEYIHPKKITSSILIQDMYTTKINPIEFGLSKSSNEVATYKIEEMRRLYYPQPFINKSLMVEILLGILFSMQIAVTTFLGIRLSEIIKSSVDGKNIEMWLFMGIIGLAIYKTQALIMLLLALIKQSWELVSKVNWLYTFNLFFYSLETISFMGFFALFLFTVDLHESGGMEAIFGIILFAMSLFEFLMYVTTHSLLMDIVRNNPYVQMLLTTPSRPPYKYIPLYI